MNTGTMMLRELTIRYTVKTDADGQPVTIGPTFDSPKVCAEMLAILLREEAVEVFAIVCLATNRHIMAYHEVGRGCLDSTIVHPREVFKAACLANASALILAHNHPSGDPTPSVDDRRVTRRLTESGQIVGIDVLDHIIVGDGRYFSFREAGLL